ncbi:hypothetical protein SKAU_G00349280 [Synaphobranchus kaupii]|uniref:Uncharacterized protein n=1 Tax=Synaphobranchus kaupii TaxID=118154 RepID=A0A9Q1EK64_SYNKA|nr:hypothetical protein SKAU_G00349280 [Synaphobranchus kaupii]
MQCFAALWVYINLVTKGKIACQSSSNAVGLGAMYTVKRKTTRTPHRDLTKQSDTTTSDGHRRCKQLKRYLQGTCRGSQEFKMKRMLDRATAGAGPSPLSRLGKEQLQRTMNILPEMKNSLPMVHCVKRNERRGAGQISTPTALHFLQGKNERRFPTGLLGGSMLGASLLIKADGC